MKQWCDIESIQKSRRHAGVKKQLCLSEIMLVLQEAKSKADAVLYKSMWWSSWRSEQPTILFDGIHSIALEQLEKELQKKITSEEVKDSGRETVRPVLMTTTMMMPPLMMMQGESQ
jgi:hypothetical protein